MASIFGLEIVTPEKLFFSGDVEMVSLKTLDGEIGILKEHMPMIVAVAVGPVRILQDEQWMEARLSEGFMEIKRDKTIILTDSAEWTQEK